MTELLGSIELGGTKIVCGYGNGPDNIIARHRIPTTEPVECMNEVLSFFSSCEQQYGALKSIGVATFGPVDIMPSSVSYGSILKTPKPHWSNFNILSALKEHYAVPMAVSTDVNGALLSEVRWGAGRGYDNVVYITVGTGIGAGIMVNGQLVSGFLHPEIGHMRIPAGGVEGICPFHGNCLEGLVCGPAIAARAGCSAEALPANDPLWDDIAQNLADMCINLITILATQRIILGGGVMYKEGLLEKIKHQFSVRMADYLPINERAVSLDNVLVRPEIPNDCGVLGGFILAEQASNLHS